MTRLISALMAVALLVSVAPVLAGDSFHALGRLPADLTPLDDAQLATVEGGFEIEIDFENVAFNIAVVVQTAVQLNFGNAFNGGAIVQVIEQKAEVAQDAAANN
jgi:hypothetical protein